MIQNYKKELSPVCFLRIVFRKTFEKQVSWIQKQKTKGKKHIKIFSYKIGEFWQMRGDFAQTFRSRSLTFLSCFSPFLFTREHRGRRRTAFSAISFWIMGHTVQRTAGQTIFMTSITALIYMKPTAFPITYFRPIVFRRSRHTWKYRNDMVPIRLGYT